MIYITFSLNNSFCGVDLKTDTVHAG